MMLKKSLKTLSISLCIPLLSISIYGCDNAPGEEPIHDSASITNINTTTEKEVGTSSTNSNQKSIPSFETAIESLKEQSIGKFEDTLKEEFNKIKTNQLTTESEGKFSLSYGDTKGSINFNFSGSADENLENILGGFKIALGASNADILDEDFPKKINLEIAYTALIQKAKQYFVLNNINIDDLKNLITDEDDETKWKGVTKIINTLKGKWIVLNSETICNEESSEYSEAGCTISESANKYIELLSGSNKEDLKSKSSEIIKIANALLNSIKTSIFSTNVLTNPQQVEYEGKQAYKFSINKEKLKKDMKAIVKTYAEYYAEQMTKKMQKYNSIYDEEFEMTEEEINEMKQEISEGVDEMFDELYSHVTMKEIDAYLVYDEKTKTFDLIVKKLEIEIHRENETCDYSRMYNENDEYVGPQCKTEDIKTLLSIGFSSKKHLFVIVASDGKKTKFKTTFNYNITGETFKIKVDYSGINDDEEFIEDLVTYEMEISKKESGNTTKNKILFSIKIKKELFDLEKDISAEFSATGKSDFGESSKIPYVGNAISFHNIEKIIEDISKEYQSPREKDYRRRSDLSQLGSAILSYYNNKGMFPETNSNNMVSINKIEKELIDVVELKDVPKDPEENSSFYYDGTTFKGEYGYKLMTKNTISKGGFVLMSKAETEDTANFVAGIKLDGDLSKIKVCTYITKGDKTSTEVSENGTCTYTNPNELRYIYAF